MYTSEAAFELKCTFKIKMSTYDNPKASRPKRSFDDGKNKTCALETVLVKKFILLF